MRRYELVQIGYQSFSTWESCARTSDCLADFNDLGEGESVASDTAYRGPLALMIDCAGHDGCEICYCGQGHDGIFVAVDDDAASVVEVDDGLQWLEISGCLVRERQVVQEQARLKQGIRKDLVTELIGGVQALD